MNSVIFIGMDVHKNSITIAWKAQLRLCARCKRLMAKGKSKQIVVTAIARELSAFLWAIAKTTAAAGLNKLKATRFSE